jgi:hypothetical protein
MQRPAYQPEAEKKRSQTSCPRHDPPGDIKSQCSCPTRRITLDEMKAMLLNNAEAVKDMEKFADKFVDLLWDPTPKEFFGCELPNHDPDLNPGAGDYPPKSVRELLEEHCEEQLETQPYKKFKLDNNVQVLQEGWDKCHDELIHMHKLANDLDKEVIRKDQEIIELKAKLFAEKNRLTK